MMQSDVSLTKQFHPDFVLSFLLTACQTPAPTFSTRTLGHVCPPHLSVAKLLQCNSQSEPSIGSDSKISNYKQWWSSLGSDAIAWIWKCHVFVSHRLQMSLDSIFPNFQLRLGGCDLMISTLGQMCSWNAAQTHQAWHPHMPQVSITRPILHNLFSEFFSDLILVALGCHVDNILFSQTWVSA